MVKSTLGQLRFFANVHDIGVLTGSIQSTNDASRASIINLAKAQAVSKGIAMPVGQPVVVFIDPPPCDAGGEIDLGACLLDRAAEHTFYSHELGHALGYEHSHGVDGREYFDPYCIMSARTFGGQRPFALTPPPGVSYPESAFVCLGADGGDR